MEISREQVFEVADACGGTAGIGEMRTFTPDELQKFAALIYQQGRNDGLERAAHLADCYGEVPGSHIATRIRALKQESKDGTS